MIFPWIQPKQFGNVYLAPHRGVEMVVQNNPGIIWHHRRNTTTPQNPDRYKPLSQENHVAPYYHPGP